MMKKISSRLTLVYEFGMPSVGVAFHISIIIGAIWFFPKEHFTLYISFIPASIFISTLVFFPLIKLNDVYLDGDEVVIDNFF